MKKILVVDDEKHIRMLYEKEFTEEGYAVRATGDPDEAAAYCSQENVDLVILDIKLTDKDGGLELLRKIKQHHKALPVILSTAYPHYQYDFASWVADAYVVKSGNLADLKEKVKEILPPFP
jgi:DNA-binding response OmpR family regulator